MSAAAAAFKEGNLIDGLVSAGAGDGGRHRPSLTGVPFRAGLFSPRRPRELEARVRPRATFDDESSQG